MRPFLPAAVEPMPVHLFWGEDGFLLERAVQRLRTEVVDEAWAAFNLQKLGADSLVEALNQAVTPPFGLGGRLIWIAEANIFKECPAEPWTEFERTLPRIPETNHLLFTQAAKPDGRLKSTRLVGKTGKVREFPLVAPWMEDQIKEQVTRMALEQGVRLTSGAVQRLVEAVGNDSRRLDSELAKLALFSGEQIVDEQAVSALTPSGAQTSFKLGAALLAGQAAEALTIVDELLLRNEPALRILAVLTNQFRTWLWVRIMVEAGERERTAIAAAAEINNPNRVFFLQKEVERATTQQLSRILPLLLDTEVQLKSGQPERLALQIFALKASEALAQRTGSDR